MGYDLARAMAVFGMVVVNFQIAMGAAGKGPDWLVALLGLLEGRAAATFVVLAGIGISLQTRRARLSADAPALHKARSGLMRRALILFVVGLLYIPIWPADILHFYGLYIALAALLLSAPSWRLGLYAAGLVSAFAVAIFVFDYEKGWDWQTLSYEGFWTVDGMLRHLLFNGFHPVVPWAAFVLIGMIVGRLDLRQPAIRRRVLAVGAATALLAELGSRLLVRTFLGLAQRLGEGPDAIEAGDVEAIFGSAPMPPMPLYMLAGAGTACVVITLCVTLAERFAEASWLKPLVWTGQLALTLYVAHVIVGMGTLEALGMLEDQTTVVSLSAAVIFCAASVVVSTLIRWRWSRGPLEALMRLASR